MVAINRIFFIEGFRAQAMHAHARPCTPKHAHESGKLLTHFAMFIFIFNVHYCLSAKLLPKCPIPIINFNDYLARV
jgi:hypothetical protein